METIIVSACLLGDNVKYNGGNNYTEEIEKLKELYDIIPVCPEVFGGLKIPRDPSEIKGNSVVSNKGKNVTKEFIKGANDVINIVKYKKIKYAILKENSPSCGVHQIYDGNFKKKLILGQGITTQKLVELGVQVYSENEIDKLLVLE